MQILRNMSKLERFSTVLYGFRRFFTISYVCFFFHTGILEVAKISIPKTTGNCQHKNTPWWNNNCEKAIEDFKKARNKLQGTKI